MAESDPVAPSEAGPVPEMASCPARAPSADGPRDNVIPPGSYVWNDTGRLLRVPAYGPSDGSAPVIEYMAPRGLERVTRLSADPRLPVAELRILSATASIRPRF